MLTTRLGGVDDVVVEVAEALARQGGMGLAFAAGCTTAAFGDLVLDRGRLDGVVGLAFGAGCAAGIDDADEATGSLSMDSLASITQL